ncbi:vacuolar protein sorting-associated protein 26A isoform X1 [Ovis aries]|nr:vacuolar protein sorting-associated protein 26A isoform X1 [Ovis aries]
MMENLFQERKNTSCIRKKILETGRPDILPRARIFLTCELSRVVQLSSLANSIMFSSPRRNTITLAVIHLAPYTKCLCPHKVNVAFKQPGKRLEHQGIRIEFVGQIELFNDKSNTHEFVNLVKELALPGELTQSRSYDFEFMQVEKPYESYIGANVRLRYFLKVTIVRRLTDLVKEYDLIVHQLATYPDVNNSIKMEVGIEDCLHIEFEYNKSKYHLKDVIVGKIYFLLVRIKIQHMELQLIKKEITGIGPSTTTETETIAKYEIMDGAPVKGESIPIRLFLAGYDPTPTMRDVNKKFSVRYFLNLVLVDEEDRRYFKQQEIILWRKAPEKLRKQRTNFHQRFESPESQASAEQPEM